MGEPARRVAPPIDQEVAEALSLCGGDPLKALQIALIANAFLEARIDQLTAEASAGFSRGRVKQPKPRKTAP